MDEIKVNGHIYSVLDVIEIQGEVIPILDIEQPQDEEERSPATLITTANGK